MPYVILSRSHYLRGADLQMALPPDLCIGAQMGHMVVH